METNQQPSLAQSQREGFTKQIGNTIYDVSFHYSKQSQESANDKIKRLIEYDLLHGTARK